MNERDFLRHTQASPRREFDSSRASGPVSA